jgi:hypothetical protein
MTQVRVVRVWCTGGCSTVLDFLHARVSLVLPVLQTSRLRSATRRSAQHTMDAPMRCALTTARTCLLLYIVHTADVEAEERYQEKRVAATADTRLTLCS